MNQPPGPAPISAFDVFPDSSQFAVGHAQSVHGLPWHHVFQYQAMEMSEPIARWAFEVADGRISCYGCHSARRQKLLSVYGTFNDNIVPCHYYICASQPDDEISI